MKKWLYGVALGALLIAGNAAGITVHEVLSNNFWSDELSLFSNPNLIPARVNFSSVLFNAMQFHYKSKYVRIKYISSRYRREIETHWGTCTNDYKNFKTDGISWKYKNWLEKYYDNRTYEKEDGKEKLTLQTVKNRIEPYKYKAKIMCRYHYYTKYNDEPFILLKGDTVLDEQSSFKPLVKNERPIGPIDIAPSWYAVTIDEDNGNGRNRYFDFEPEHTAVTNIISDTEAYITGTASQTGHYDFWDGHKADHDTYKTCTYTKHITTDADHVYFQQESMSIFQTYGVVTNTVQREYTATFKKGVWKGSTETFSFDSRFEVAQWYLDLFNY